MVETRERKSSSIDVEGGRDQELDDDNRPRRTGTLWTASAHVITAVIGSGVLSLTWATAQLGWIAGTATQIIFALITYYTAVMLGDCYRNDDSVHGKRNYTYITTWKLSSPTLVHYIYTRISMGDILGTRLPPAAAVMKDVNLFGTTIGYTITGTASISAAAVMKANCFHRKGHNAECMVSDSLYMVGFGVIQVFLSQLPNFSDLWWLSILVAVMSFSYSLIAVGLCTARVISGNYRACIFEAGPCSCLEILGKD